MTRVAPTMVRREHNNGVPKFWVGTDEETKNTTPLSLARKEWVRVCVTKCNGGEKNMIIKC